MESLESENRALKEKNKLLQKELDKVEFKYHRLKSQYVTLMKKCIAYQMELQKSQKLPEPPHQIPQQLSLNSDSGLDLQSKKSSLSYSKSPPSHLEGKPHKQESLIDLFFVLEPAQHQKYEVKFLFPHKPSEQLLLVSKRLDRYVYPNGICLTLLEDDEEQSRHNQLIFGNLCQDLLFILENDKNGEITPALRQLNPSGKYFCYVFERPTIMNMNKQKKTILESTVAFCFITKFPFRQFFAEVNRSFLQILKLKYIHGQQQQWKDYSIFNDMLTSLHNTNIYTFPIDRAWKTESAELKLNVQASRVILQQDKCFAQSYIMKFNPSSLSQLIHYIMIQKHILFYTSDKLILNQLFEFLRIVLRPLAWPFAILYNLTQQLVPFLQSPVPVLIGISKSKKQLEKQNYNFSEYLVMDLKQMSFVKRYDNLKKYDYSIIQLAKHLETQQHNRLSTVQWFIRSKISLMKKGASADLGEFQQQFKETQMVEQYLQSA